MTSSQPALPSPRLSSNPSVNPLGRRFFLSTTVGISAGPSIHLRPAVLKLLYAGVYPAVPSAPIFGYRAGDLSYRTHCLCKANAGGVPHWGGMHVYTDTLPLDMV